MVDAFSANTPSQGPLADAQLGSAQSLAFTSGITNRATMLDEQIPAGLFGEAHQETDYEPGRRLYFFDPDGIEVELVQYEPAVVAR